MFLSKFLRVSGEGRLISDLSIQRRHVSDDRQQRIALRLAHCAAQPAPLEPLTTITPSSYPLTTDVDDVITVHHVDSSADHLNNKHHVPISNCHQRATSTDESSCGDSDRIATVECLMLPSDDVVTCDCAERPKCLQFENGISVFD